MPIMRRNGKWLATPGTVIPTLKLSANSKKTLKRISDELKLFQQLKDDFKHSKEIRDDIVKDLGALDKKTLMELLEPFQNKNIQAILSESRLTSVLSEQVKIKLKRPA